MTKPEPICAERQFDNDVQIARDYAIKMIEETSDEVDSRRIDFILDVLNRVPSRSAYWDCNAEEAVKKLNELNKWHPDRMEDIVGTLDEVGFFVTVLHSLWTDEKGSAISVVFKDGKFLEFQVKKVEV